MLSQIREFCNVRSFTQAARETGLSRMAESGMSLLLIFGIGGQLLVGGSLLSPPTDSPPVSPLTTQPDGKPAVTPQTVHDKQPAEIEDGYLEGLKLDPSELDLGLIPLNESRSGTVMIRNTTNQTMFIEKTVTSCRCTAAQLVDREIPPGASVPLTVTLKGRNRPGPMNQYVQVIIENLGYAKISVHGEVSMIVHAEPSLIRIDKVQSGELVVTAIDGRAFRVLSSNMQPPVYVEPLKRSDEPQVSHHLRWDITQYVDCKDVSDNPMPRWWIIETDHPDCPLVDVSLRGRCTRVIPPVRGQQWVLADQRILLGTMKAGETVEFDVEMKWIRKQPPNDSPMTMKVIDGPIKVNIIRTKRLGSGYMITVSVTTESEFQGVMYGRLQIVSNRGFTWPLTVLGRVVK